MSASFGLAVVAGLEHNGVKVLYPFGDAWLTKGNGQTSSYQGMIWHHTATGYANTAPSVLWNGRPDLSGPLCNTSGNADGTVSMIATHPANHAGASGGRSMGPLPVTTTFNKYVWGHEIVYPGDQPMTAAQYRTMQILGGVISGILRRPTPEWCRGHAETSITGKWDPGYAPSKTIDLATARRDTWAALSTTPGGDWFDMATKEDLVAVIRAELGRTVYETTSPLPNRRGPNGTNLKDGGADTLFGYSINADGFGYRIERKLDELITLVMAAGVDPAVVSAAIAQALGGGLEITGTAVPKRVA